MLFVNQTLPSGPAVMPVGASQNSIPDPNSVTVGVAAEAPVVRASVIATTAANPWPNLIPNPFATCRWCPDRTGRVLTADAVR